LQVLVLRNSETDMFPHHEANADSIDCKETIMQSNAAAFQQEKLLHSEYLLNRIL